MNKPKNYNPYVHVLAMWWKAYLTKNEVEYNKANKLLNYYERREL